MKYTIYCKILRIKLEFYWVFKILIKLEKERYIFLDTESNLDGQWVYVAYKLKEDDVTITDIIGVFTDHHMAVDTVCEVRNRDAANPKLDYLSLRYRIRPIRVNEENRTNFT